MYKLFDKMENIQMLAQVHEVIELQINFDI